jgi:hypothetical protein
MEWVFVSNRGDERPKILVKTNAYFKVIMLCVDFIEGGDSDILSRLAGDFTLLAEAAQGFPSPPRGRDDRPRDPHSDYVGCA